MNICLVNNLFPPILTGSSFYTQDLARSLYSRGHKIIVITNQVKSKAYLEDEGGLRVYRLPVYKLPEVDLWMKFPHFNFSIFPGNLKKIEHILKMEKIDIIHQCNNIFDLVFASAWYSKKLGIPLICSIMTQIQHTNGFYNKILEIFDKTIIKYLFSRQVIEYIALDLESKRYIFERFGLKENVTFIPFSISREDTEYAFQNRKSDYGKTHFRAISVGHISNVKNRFETIRAWSHVVKKFPEATLRIIGGIFSEKSARLIKELGLSDNIEFTGKVEHSEIFSLMNDADFSCMFLSRELPFPRCVGAANMETMAFGLPAVLDATDSFFGERFPFNADEHFVMAESREPDRLSEIFIRLFEHPELREKIGKGGQRFVVETLDKEKILDEVELVYRNAMDSHKDPSLEEQRDSKHS